MTRRADGADVDATLKEGSGPAVLRKEEVDRSQDVGDVLLTVRQKVEALRFRGDDDVAVRGEMSKRRVIEGRRQGEAVRERDQRESAGRREGRLNTLRRSGIIDFRADGGRTLRRRIRFALPRRTAPAARTDPARDQASEAQTGGWGAWKHLKR